MHEKFNSIEELEVLLEKTDNAEIKPWFNENGEESKDYCRIWNTTRNHIEASVPFNRGKVVQHRDAFKPLTNALREQQGADMFGFFHNHQGRVIVEVLFNNAIVNDGSEGGIKLGLRFTNDYSQLNLKGNNFGYRSYCSNGMSLGKVLFNEISVSHKNIAGINKEILSFIDTALNKTTLLEGIIEKAKADVLMNEEDALRILVGEVSGERKARKMLELMEEQNYTMYNLYNCITNYCTHAITNETMKNYYQTMAQKILTTPSNKLFRGELKKDKAD